MRICSPPAASRDQSGAERQIFLVLKERANDGCCGGSSDLLRQLRTGMVQRYHGRVVLDHRPDFFEVLTDQT